MRPIFCGNFEYDARQNELERLFGRYGKVDRVDMKSGFAFIYMEDERDAEYAIRALDRKEFGRKGRRLRVEWTKVANHERATRRPGASRKSSNTRPSKTLFVINFDTNHTRTKDLERHFDQYGKIASVRIRRNFAFVQYESQEDATRALVATNMSKLMDRVISVEYAVRDDDERRDGFSPDRSRDRSLDRSRDRRRSPSPYKRERGSPDYGRGASPAPYRRERGSPNYGRGPSPYRRERVSPDYGRGLSPGPYRRNRSDHGRAASRSPRKERVSAEHVRTHSRSHSPYRRERLGDDNGHGPSRSPYKRERSTPENGPTRSPYKRQRSSSENGPIRSPYKRDRGSPEDGSIRSPYKRERDSPEDGSIRSPYKRERDSPEEGSIRSPYKRDIGSPENGRGPSTSPYGRERDSPENGRASSPVSVPDPRDSPNYGGPESPMHDRYNSRSPQAEE